jgi:hypothetical protein
MKTHEHPHRAVDWYRRAGGGYRLALAVTLALAGTIAVVSGATPAGAAPSRDQTAAPGTGARSATPGSGNPQPLEADDDLPRPAWWSGGCDVGHNSISVRLTATFDGLQACGPGSDQSGENYLVRFFPAAWGEYEWQCVEISMRWMYMAWGVDPYGANGNDVVANYPNGSAGYPTLTIVDNGAEGDAPQPGDVLSLDDADDDGHTEVVTSSSVNGSGDGTVTAITENDGGQSTGWATLTVTDWVVSDGSSGDTVLAWLHNPGWYLEEPVLWDLTTAGTLQIKDGDSLGGTFATVGTGIAQAAVVGGDGYGPSPIVVALTTTGELEGGYYLPGLPRGSLTPLAANVKSFALSAAPDSNGHPVLAWVTDAGSLEVAAGGLTDTPIEEATGVATIALAPNSGPSDPLIGYISTAGTFYDREGPGALKAGAPWTTVATGVTSIALAGADLATADAIEAYTAKSTFFARQGMTGPFTDEATGVSQIAASSIGPEAKPLLAYVSGGKLEVRQGAVTAGAFTEQATDVTVMSAAAAMSSVGFPIVGVIAGGEFEAEDGVLNSTWTRQASGVKSAGVAALTVS